MHKVVGPPSDLLSLHSLSRGGDNINAYFDEFSTETTIGSAKACIRWHKLAHDATQNAPVDKKLADMLSNMLVDFAITRSEYAESRAKNLENGGTDQYTAKLGKKARRLFTTSEPSGEAGELLLYYFSEQYLKYPQVLAKFPHKTNPSLHANGADGVHASLDPDNQHLRLHWGEAKLYTDVSKAMNDCFESLSEMFSQKLGAAKNSTRDIELLRDYVDLNNEDLEAALLEYLDPDNVLNNHVVYCGIALVGFDLNDYSVFHREHAVDETEKILKRVKKWGDSIEHFITKHGLLNIRLDVFCVPFLSVDKFREAFSEELK